MVILLFMTHPGITKVLFASFNCITIDGTTFMYDDLSLECYKDLHLAYILAVGMPGIVLWSVGIPVCVYRALKQNKHQMETVLVKEKFGFLFNGFRKSSYHWEIVTMLRKTTIIFISVFLQQLGVYIQALLLMPFLIVCLS